MTQYILSFMAPFIFNPFTANFDYYQTGGSTPVGGTWDFVDGTGVDFIDGSVGDFVV
jgi:hypothetical protein